jgi:hypothetical protein
MDLTKIALALGASAMMIVTAGCGPSKALESAQEYEKAACACKDAACATDASKKFAERSKDMAAAKSSEAEAITKATAAAAECVTKASMAGLPGMPAMPGMQKK